MAPSRKGPQYYAGFLLKVVHCDDVPDETVDNDWDPFDDALADADMSELVNSSREDEEKSS